MLNECAGKSNLYVQVDFVDENTKKTTLFVRILIIKPMVNS